MIQRALFFVTLAVALAPALLFAGRPLWVIAPAAMATGAALLAAGAVAWKRPRTNGWSGRLLAVAGALWAIVLAWAFVQTLPDGPARLAGEPWRSASELLGLDIQARGSLNAGATAEGILRLALYAGVALLAFWTVRARSEAWAVLWTVTAVAGLAAVYAVLQKAAGVEYVLWQEKRYYIGFATGPFENRNTFASFLAIGLAANAGLWLRALRRAVPSEIEGRERFRLTLEFLSKQGILLAAPGLAMAAAGLMSGSRAGLAAMALALGLTVALVVLRSGRTAATPLIAIGATAAVLAGLWAIGGDVAAERRGGLEASFDQRLELFADTRRIIAARPLTGVGLGAFPEAMHAVKSSDLTNDWRRAHNVYLESVAELGWPAAFLAFAAVALAGVAAARGLWTRRRLAPMPAAATAGLVAVAGHSLIDFPLQEPAICLTLALLLGAAAAQADGRERG